jgi:16S rRNA (guanine966-N2)-methyltransferase
MRIVGGSFKGHSIIAPKGMATRPTTDRVRESLFNILSHKEDAPLRGARVLDLFAGSGALGLEALSRDGAFCLFVENAAPARAAIRENIESLGLFGATRLHRRSALALGLRPASTGAPFTLVFMDPPYGKEMVAPALGELAQGQWLADNALIIIEQAKAEAPACPDGFTEIDRRIFGDTQIGFLRFGKL